MQLTDEELNILNHVIVDGQAWADNAGERGLAKKLAKYKQPYLDAKASLQADYKTRRQRDEIEEQARQDAYNNVPWNIKRLREYPNVLELVVALYEPENRAAIDKRRADVKAKYPKP